MVSHKVPEAPLAVVGGTGTYTADLFTDLSEDVSLVEDGLTFETPWGESPPFTLFEVAGRRALHVRLHGWRLGLSHARASRQVFSVLHQQCTYMKGRLVWKF